MTTTISASVSLISSAATSSTTASSSTASSGLVKLANGEYTAASVAKDQTDAAKLGLVKEKDGNYGLTAASQVLPPSSAAASASNGVQAALVNLMLGGQ